MWGIYTFPKLWQSLLLAAKYKVMPTYKQLLKRVYILIKNEEKDLNEEHRNAIHNGQGD